VHRDLAILHSHLGTAVLSQSQHTRQNGSIHGSTLVCQNVNGYINAPSDLATQDTQCFAIYRLRVSDGSFQQSLEESFSLTRLGGAVHTTSVILNAGHRCEVRMNLNNAFIGPIIPWLTKSGINGSNGNGITHMHLAPAKSLAKFYTHRPSLVQFATISPQGSRSESREQKHFLCS